MKSVILKRTSTILLRLAVLLIGAVMLGLCVLAVFVGITSIDTEGFSLILIGLCVPVIPFFYALYRALNLLSFIDKHQAFSDSSVKELKIIKMCAFLISGLFTAGMPYGYYVADREDAPGVLVLGLIVIFASFVIGVFAAVLQALLKDAIAIKSENDLTV
jgi:hypothetical protein